MNARHFKIWCEHFLQYIRLYTSRLSSLGILRKKMIRAIKLINLAYAICFKKVDFCCFSFSKSRMNIIIYLSHRMCGMILRTKNEVVWEQLGVRTTLKITFTTIFSKKLCGYHQNRSMIGKFRKKIDIIRRHLRVFSGWLKNY